MIVMIKVKNSWFWLTPFELGSDRVSCSILGRSTPHMGSHKPPPLWSQFWIKNAITFCGVLAIFWWKKRCGQRLQGRSQNLTQPMLGPQLLGFIICKGLSCIICQSWAFRCQRSVFLISTHFSRFGCFSGCHTQILDKNRFHFQHRI